MRACVCKATNNTAQSQLQPTRQQKSAAKRKKTQNENKQSTNFLSQNVKKDLEEPQQKKKERVSPHTHSTPPAFPFFTLAPSLFHPSHQLFPHNIPLLFSLPSSLHTQLPFYLSSLRVLTQHSHHTQTQTTVTFHD
jgi:hypothetical protein